MRCQTAVRLQPQQQLKAISWFLADNRKDQLDTQQRHLGGVLPDTLWHTLATSGTMRFKLTEDLHDIEAKNPKLLGKNMGEVVQHPVQAPPVLSGKRIIAVPNSLP